MEIRQRLPGGVLLLQPEGREDPRGRMTVLSPEEIRKAVPGFEMKEQRIYTMPETGTFFGIHYQADPYPQAKLISVLRGKGLDYAVDLREGSDTFGQWTVLELNGEEGLAVYIPAGFGHAFLSLVPDTVQFFAADERFVKGYAGSISWKDPDIGLKLPLENLILSEKDRQAPFLRDLNRNRKD